MAKQHEVLMRFGMSLPRVRSWSAWTARLLASLGGWALALSLASCLMGPDYRRPEVAVPERWDALMLDGAEMPSPALREDETPSAEWWTVFQDEELTRLVELALQNNHDVREAGYRVLEARALVTAAGAGLYPQLNVAGSYSRIRRSETILVGPTSGAPEGFAPPGANFDIWNALLDLRWELDLWGKIRRSLEAAEAEAEAVAIDRRGVLLSLIGDVGQTYFRLRELDDVIDITRRHMRLREDSLALLRAQAKAGLIDDLDLRRAEQLVAETAAQLPELERRRALEAHRLAVLTGTMPNALELESRPLRAHLVQPVVPMGVPAQLLERRPDIIQVERSLVAANARIGEARAYFFPSVAITGTGGFQTSEFQDWFNWASRSMSIGPSVTVPIFEGYTNVARLEVAEARYRQMLERYHQTILTAVREVSDLLTALQTRTAQLEQVRARVRAAQAARELAELRYRKGLVTYLDVIDAQRTVLTAEQALVQVERARLEELVALFKAIGGGWDAADRTGLAEDYDIHETGEAEKRPSVQNRDDKR
ncbi:MAG: efflux transporter outer membrane subunit [Nitrospirae bacterium]|nr:MAG: efflux transporter outer membrane subunit [Nitrospirota bacterium]